MGMVIGTNGLLLYLNPAFAFAGCTLGRHCGGGVGDGLGLEGGELNVARRNLNLASPIVCEFIVAGEVEGEGNFVNWLNSFDSLGSSLWLLARLQLGRFICRGLWSDIRRLHTQGIGKCTPQLTLLCLQ